MVDVPVATAVATPVVETVAKKVLLDTYWATVTVAVFEVTPPEVAETVAVPTVTAVASPVDEILATELGTDVQVATAETSAVEPSL